MGTVSISLHYSASSTLTYFILSLFHLQIDTHSRLCPENPENKALRRTQPVYQWPTSIFFFIMMVGIVSIYGVVQVMTVFYQSQLSTLSIRIPVGGDEDGRQFGAA